MVLKEPVTIRTMKDFNYENDVVPNLFYFHDEIMVPEFSTKNIKIERTWKVLLDEIMTLVEQSEITNSYRMT